MYLPEKPKAPVTAIRTLAFHQAEKITHAAAIGTQPHNLIIITTRQSSPELPARDAWGRLAGPTFPPLSSMSALDKAQND